MEQLNDSNRVIHVLNRAQLLDDSFNLARAGLLEYTTALDLSRYLEYEDDQIPWYTAIDCFTYVVERMRRSPYGYEYIKVHRQYRHNPSVENMLSMLCYYAIGQIVFITLHKNGSFFPETS